MSVSILGAGNVGLALGRALARAGITVLFGVPAPAKYAEAAAAFGARAVDVAQAIDASEIVVLAVPYTAVAGIAQGVSDWRGKILVDATNPLAPGLSGLSLGTPTSGAEVLAGLARGARVVKAFNTTGAENLGDPRYPGGAVFMPVCGDDAQARQRVLDLATQLGFDAVDLGPLAAARYLEPLAMTWIHLALKQGYGRRFAFGLLRRD